MPRSATARRRRPSAGSTSSRSTPGWNASTRGWPRTRPRATGSGWPRSSPPAASAAGPRPAPRGRRSTPTPRGRSPGSAPSATRSRPTPPSTARSSSGWAPGSTRRSSPRPSPRPGRAARRTRPSATRSGRGGSRPRRRPGIAMGLSGPGERVAAVPDDDHAAAPRRHSGPQSIPSRGGANGGVVAVLQGRGGGKAPPIGLRRWGRSAPAGCCPGRGTRGWRCRRPRPGR